MRAEPQPGAGNDPSPGCPAPRTWLLRFVLAVAVPATLLLALEAGLRLAGYGRPSTFLIPDSKPGYFRTNPDYASLFLPGNFDLRPLNFRVSRQKAPNTLRVVVLGESAAQGVPVPSFAFAPQLRAQLRARYPGREVEVLDTGIVAINSHVVYQIAREMAGFDPDLFVVYMGNNEVVGPYGPGCAYLSEMPPLWVIRASVLVRSTRTGQLMGTLLGGLLRRGGRGAEWGGMSMFTHNAVAGDDPRLEAVYANFASNLRGIVDAASESGAKTILCTAVANLKDCPPFLSLHRDGLSGPGLAAWTAAFDEGRIEWRLGEDDGARARLTEALRIDPRYADTEFMLGSLDMRAGSVESARRHFISALHWDALRFRPDPRINQIIREVAKGGSGVTLVDSAAALGSDAASIGAPSGRGILFEHVHLDWEGNFRLARMMAQGCAGALQGGEGGPPWLDSPACADALAYTRHERYPMLLRVDVLVRKPPFTNQLTYVGDEARLAREIDSAKREALDPAVLRHASEVANAALVADPDNPALAGILEGIDLDMGDLEGALELARRAGSLLPSDAASSADEASILMRMGRFDEAEGVLTASVFPVADLELIAPVVSDFWTDTKRFAEGEGQFRRAIAASHGDLRLRLALAGLMHAAGDTAGAERELRAILAEDPVNPEALEALVAFLQETGRGAEADSESVAGAGVQLQNQANNLRAAKVCEARGDQEHSAQFMEAAAESGPVNATFELTVALKLYKLGRMPGVLSHLAEARSLSLDEGNPAVTGSIDALIGRMRGEASAGAQPGQKSE